MNTRILVMALVLGIAAAACSSDSDPVATDVTATSSTTTTASGTSTTSEPIATTTTTTAPLTASFRGVTAEAISVGVAIIDFEELNAQGFIDFTHGDKQATYQVLFDDINERGGINGRRIAAVYETILPIGNTEGEEACLRLTEDVQVFAVIGNWVGESLLCVTDQHETNYVGHMPNQSLMDRGRAVLASPDINPERRLEAMLSVLDQTGALEGETVGILTQETLEESVRTEAVPALTELGVSVGSVGVITTTDDPLGAEAEVATFTEVWGEEGVTTVFFLGGSAQDLVPDVVDRMGDIGKVSDDPEVARQLADSSGRADAYAGMITINGLNTTTREQFDEPRMQACFATVTDRLPDVGEVLPPDEQLDGEPDWFTGIRDACTNVDVFVAAATAAGPELTNDSFREGLESVGSLEIAGKVHASLGPGKWDADDGFRLYVFDPDEGAAGAFVAQSDIVDVTAG